MEITAEKTVSEIISRLKSQKAGGAVFVEGTWGSFAPLLIKHVSDGLKRPILYIRPHIDDADKAVDDLAAFGSKDVQPLPAWEGEEELADATDEIRAERARIVSRVSYLDPQATSPESRLIIPTSIQALQQPVPSPAALSKSSLTLNVDEESAPEKIVAWLVDNEFERVEKVDMPGQFAQRGGIVDIFAALAHGFDGPTAVRIEFFGDTIESIRNIDHDTQRSTHELKEISVISTVADIGLEKEMFTNILPANTVIVFEEPVDISEVAVVYLERVDKPQRLFDFKKLYQSLQKFTQLQISRFAAADASKYLKVNVKSVQQYQPSTTTAWAGHKEALQNLVDESKSGKKVYLYCEAEAEIQRVTEIVTQTEKKLPRNFKLIQGFINQGFCIDSLDTIIISHHELFGQFAIRRRQRPIRPSAPVDTLEDLQVGDFVVHGSYGIGKYLGVTTIEDKAGAGEYLTIEFADKVKVQISTDNIALVQKYIGTSPKRPPLSKVGSKKWLTMKKKVEDSIKDLAVELLEMQARRQATGGIEAIADSTWQKEFEGSFPYQETADQSTAIEQIKDDMQRSISMDRLLCGDVGYGKTEIAMRAAFKAVESGKQAAVLVPTTVLCVQHGRTFAERFADFPIAIDVLNRFKTAKQAAEIVERAKRGKVDVLIGTHRLLSKDVGFRDLGLLIIDEEQRFGVEHKEKLKRLRVNVDILTMTATPIPRTLHMSLLGLRDISSLGTPPLDRRAVVTRVTRYDPAMVKQAINRELNRQGQAFFLHNRVKSIERRCWELRKLFKDDSVKFDIAHGQMTKRELENAMINFVVGNTDVLVCTTIIESGLDIPNANTIFIDDADRFGLAELHQLRGRVGRYKHRAYAYMMLPRNRSITPIASRRLKAIEEYSHLGAGFRIALRDLEIRGAGNILGPQQSGHIQTVGYQMYCSMLTTAVKKLKGQSVEPVPTTIIELGFSQYIPKSYIPLDRSRMEVYRKIAVARNIHDVDQLRAELKDVFGQPPGEVEGLLELAELRIEAAKHNIKSIAASANNLIFSFSKDAKIDTKKLFADIKGRVDHVEPGVIYLRLNRNYFEQRTLIMLLRKILTK